MEKTKTELMKDLEKSFKDVHHSWFFIKNVSVCIIEKFTERSEGGSEIEIEISEENSERFKKYENIRALDEVLGEIGIKTREILLLEDSLLKISFEKN